MKTMNEAEMLEKLAGCGRGTRVFLSYIAGRVNLHPNAQAERERAEDEGLNLRHYTGTLESLRDTSKGQKLLTLWVEERDSHTPEGALVPGNYRAFNPNLGRMLTLEVLDPVLECWFAL